MNKILFIILLMASKVILAQVKSQMSTIQLQGKNVSSFSIELPQQLVYVNDLFNAKFEISSLGNPQNNTDNFFFFKQVRLAKISSSFLDFYYQLVETKTDNGSVVKINLAISRGYDNFISIETDSNASNNILEMLNDIGVSVERKNFEILIVSKEQDLSAEKKKLIYLEEELQAIENEKKELDKKLNSKSDMLKRQARTTQIMGSELQKLKLNLSDFEKNINNKNKSVLNSISKL